MAGFTYFIETDAANVKPKDVGLAYAFTTSPETCQCTVGPSGRKGVILQERKRHSQKHTGYYPAEQTWRKLPACDGLPERWVGYWNDGKPGPGDLERPAKLPAMVGYTLGECKWDIPTLTEIAPTGESPCRLPSREDFNDDGEFVTLPPDGELGALWDAVHPLALHLCGFAADDVPGPTHAELRAAVVSLIVANYVVSSFELAILGCLRSDNAQYANVIMASCRGQWMLNVIAEEKKTKSGPIEST